MEIFFNIMTAKTIVKRRNCFRKRISFMTKNLTLFKQKFLSVAFYVISDTSNKLHSEYFPKELLGRTKVYTFILSLDNLLGKIKKYI